MHPLEKFTYCPKCGSKHFDINTEKSRKCDNCGFEFFANPSSSTAAFIFNEKGELLVARRAKEPAKGTLDLPGGFVDNNETAEQGIAREIKEETGLEVEKISYLFSLPNIYIYSGMEIHTLDMFFVAHVSGDQQPKAADDAAELMWVPVDDLHTEQFGLRSIRQALYEYFKK